MENRKLLAAFYSFLFLFASLALADDSTNSCEQFTAGVSNLQQDQLNLVSESCQKAQKYPNDVVTKSSSICSLAYLQKKYNALQAEAAILLGLRKLNSDTINQYNDLVKRRQKKVEQAKHEAEDLLFAVKRVNGFHSLLKDEKFKNLVRNSNPKDLPSISRFCDENPTSCSGITDLNSMRMVSGFVAQYLKKMEATSPDKKNLDNDFKIFDDMLIRVPENQVMVDLQKDIKDLADSKLSEEEKKVQLEKIQVNLAQMKSSGLFESNEVTKERMNQSLTQVTADSPMNSMANLIIMQMMTAQKRALTTSSIEALMNDVDPTPTESSDVVMDIKKFVQTNIAPQYKTYHGQSMVNQNQAYSDNLLKKIKSEIAEIVDDNGKMKDARCPGHPDDYRSIGITENEATCNALYNKYIDLVKAREFAQVDKSAEWSNNSEAEFKNKLVELECLSEEKSVQADVLETERKSILSCLEGKAAANGELDQKLAKNSKDLEVLKDQIDEIYKSSNYQSLDVLKNNGVQQYLSNSCNKVEIKQQTYSHITCNPPQDSSIDVFVDANNNVIAELDKNIRSEKDQDNKRDRKKQQEQLLAACADADIAARSGVICTVVKTNDKNLKKSEKVALEKNNKNYEFKDGKVYATPKASAGTYLGAGVLNAMGTALTSLRSYQQNMAVTGMYKQAATYSAYAEYQQKNQLYWIPKAPQNFTSPYLYTGAPLGTINPYSTNFNYNNNSFYYNTSYDPLATIKNGAGGSGSNSSWGGFN